MLCIYCIIIFIGLFFSALYFYSHEMLIWRTPKLVFSLIEALRLAAEFQFLSLGKKIIITNNIPGAAWCSLFPNRQSLCIKAGSTIKKNASTPVTHISKETSEGPLHTSLHMPTHNLACDYLSSISAALVMSLCLKLANYIDVVS